MNSAKAKTDHHRRGVKHRKYTYEERQKIMKMIKDGAKNCDITRAMNVPESTIRSMRKQQATLPATLNIFARFSSDQKRTKNTDRNRILAITEHYLQLWVSRRDREGGNLTGPRIRAQARLYYSAVAKKKKIANPPKFNASVGWLSSFKKRCEVKFAKIQGERGSADTEAAKAHPEVFKKLVEDGGYTRQQIFNCDETGFFWKRSPQTTFISKNEKKATGVKASKERFTALLTCNASGDYKMKPLVVARAARPRPYRHANMNNLNVYWSNNKKAWVTTSISAAWFDNHFVPDARRYCQRINKDFKIILCMDNAPGHARYLVDRHPNIQVVFLPANTTSLLQPLDQEIIANVKMMYYRDLYAEISNKTDSNVELNQIDMELSK